MTKKPKPVLRTLPLSHLEGNKTKLLQSNYFTRGYKLFTI